MVNSKQKGKRVELEIAHWLQEHGLPSARRTQQFNGKGIGSLSDIIAPDDLPTWHIECKGTQSPLLNRSTLIKWVEQIKRDCPDALQPVILNKANGKPIIAIVPYNVFLHYKSSVTTKEKIVIEDSFYPSTYLESIYEEIKIAIAVGAAAPENAIPILYYMVEEYVLVFMLAEDWLRMIRRA